MPSLSPQLAFSSPRAQLSGTQALTALTASPNLIKLLKRAFGESTSFNLVTANPQPFEKYFLFQKKKKKGRGATDYSKEFNKEISTFYEKDF